LKIAASVAEGWMWFRAALLLFVAPPLALLLWTVYKDPGTPIVLRMLHARALEVLGMQGLPPEELARAMRNDARRARRWELGVGAAASPDAAAGEGLRQRS